MNAVVNRRVMHGVHDLPGFFARLVALVLLGRNITAAFPCVLLLSCLVAAPALAAEAERPAKKVLLIGIDGCRYDAVQYSQAKHLKELANRGAWSDHCDVLGDRKTGAATITGPGWSSILTGVWADKHGVKDNAFAGANFEKYPALFARLKAARPRASAVALVSWKPFRQYVFADSDDCRFLVDGDAKGYAEGDRQVTAAAVALLTDGNPDALFAYFGEVDITGHGYGFHPRSPKYTNAIEAVDDQIGRLLAAMRGRKTFAQEDWLTIVCTDHGGQGKEHGLGENVPEIRTGFLILSGPSVPPGRIDAKTYNVDVAVTALTHLGVAIDPEWQLDGKPVGLAGNN